MSTDKTKQQQLTQWLKKQKIINQSRLTLLLVLGSLNGLTIILQAWLLATLLQSLIIEHQDKYDLVSYFITLIGCFLCRAVFVYLREQIGFAYGSTIRQTIRKQLLDRLESLGPSYIKGKPVGSWTSIIIDQIDDLQDFYSRYLPQMYLAAIIPFMIFLAILPINWAAALILFVTAPLIPIFMILVGLKAAEQNRKNFVALSRLSGYFLDRLKGLETLRVFNQQKNEEKAIGQAAEQFRLKTMEVLRQAFLSSAVLEFFTSISIALVAVYFGFFYLGQFHFGTYNTSVTLFAGFLSLILAPEFYQPLRDLGSFYHAKAQAVGAADSLQTFLTSTPDGPTEGQTLVPFPDIKKEGIELIATDLVALSPDNRPLNQPISFIIKNRQKVAIIGKSGCGKTSLLNVLLGFLPYQGSLKINNIELNQLDLNLWRQQLSWVGQHPYLPADTIRENILLAAPQNSPQHLNHIIQQTYIDEFLPLLPEGVDTHIGGDTVKLSVGQMQRIAIARALVVHCSLLLLDEATASLDALSEQFVRQTLNDSARKQTTIFISHKIYDTDYFDKIIVLTTQSTTE